MQERNKIVIIGSDHAGYELKEFLKAELIKQAYEIIDFGPDSADSVDYPDIIHPLANSMNNDPEKKGIIICGSGNGVSMTANKYPNIRAALCWNEEISELARKHNDANILVLPGRFLKKELALKIAKVFLNTKFEGGRHQRRINKIPIP